MILTIHAIAGAAVANQFQNKLIAWILAFLSHFLLDAIPHREYSLENVKFGFKSQEFLRLAIKILIDLISGFILIIIFTKQTSNLPQNLIGGFCALIPDGLSVLWIIIKNNNLRKFFGKQEIIRDNTKLINRFLQILENILEKFYHNCHNNLHWLKNTPLFWGILSQVIILIISLYSLINW